MNIVMQQTYQTNGYSFIWMKNYESIEIVYTYPDCNDCTRGTTNKREKFYKVVIDSVDYLIPDWACVETNEVFPEEYSQRDKYFTDKHQDQVTDYHKTVKQVFGVDIPEGYSADHNGKDYIQTVVKTNKSKYLDNKYEIIQAEE